MWQGKNPPRRIHESFQMFQCQTAVRKATQFLIQWLRSQLKKLVKTPQGNWESYQSVHAVGKKEYLGRCPIFT